MRNINRQPARHASPSNPSKQSMSSKASTRGQTPQEQQEQQEDTHEQQQDTNITRTWVNQIVCTRSAFQEQVKSRPLQPKP
jgi:hypothetical protein